MSLILVYILFAQTKFFSLNPWNEYLQFFQNNSLSVGSTTERLNFVGSTEGTLLVSLIGPTLGAAFGTELASCVKSSGLAFGCKERNMISK